MPEGTAFAPTSQLFSSALKRSTERSVPPANYASDCFVTSEAGYNDVLVKRRPAAGTTTGAYLGVGPCQNLSYAGALRPRLVLVVDARMDNLLEHLIFKVLMERAATPLAYLGLLFGREPAVAGPLPPGPGPLLAAFDAAPVAPAAHAGTVRWIKKELAGRWDIGSAYHARIDHLCGEFFRRQLDITSVAAALLANLNPVPSLRDVIRARSSYGVNLHVLTDAERYGYVRELQLADRIIPMLGNVVSADTIAQVNEVLREAGERLSHVYLSNLEEFLLGRYLLDESRVASKPNPTGLLVGEHAGAYRALLARLSELDAGPDAALIRFFFPGTVDGYQVGHFPHLEGDVRLLRGFLDRWGDRLPRSVLETYL